MSQAGSQAGRTKATWWSITAFNDEMHRCMRYVKGEEPLPYGEIRHLEGGMEKCPETGKLHFQGALQCYRQERLGFLKRIFPTAHLEMAKDVNKLKKYAMKKETAVGEKLKITQEAAYLTPSDVLRLVSQQMIKNGLTLDVVMTRYGTMLEQSLTEKNPRKIDVDKIALNYYRQMVNEIMTEDKMLRDSPAMFVRADVTSAWRNFWKVYLKEAEDEAKEERLSSITQTLGCRGSSLPTLVEQDGVSPTSPSSVDQARLGGGTPRSNSSAGESYRTESPESPSCSGTCCSCCEGEAAWK